MPIKETKSRDNILSKKTLEILELKYNNDFSQYQKAEKEVIDYYSLLEKLKNVNGILENRYENTSQKHTHINLKNNVASIQYSDCTEPLLAYSLEFLALRRIFPFSLNTFLNKNKDKDLKNVKNVDDARDASRVFTWVKDRILNTQFTLNNISIDREKGGFLYSTSMRDKSYGNVLQFVTGKIDKNKILQISGTDLKDNLVNLSNDYHSLFGYFMMFGFTEFYARCTCPDYVRKYSKKVGISNYFCPHILYSMAQMPYYMLYAL